MLLEFKGMFKDVCKMLGIISSVLLFDLLL